MADRDAISKKQQEILDFMKKEIYAKGYPPSVREICEAVNLKSTSSVHAHLEALEKKGYIRKDATKPRAIEIIDDNFAEQRFHSSPAFDPIPEVQTPEFQSVPLIGSVAAGQPIVAEERIDSYLPVPVEYLNTDAQTFLLSVHGESMINAGIFDGDYILVEQTKNAMNGDMIVALIEDSATVKTFYRENGYIRLQPENDTMNPIIVTQEQYFEVLGRVIGVMRFFNKKR